MDAKELRDLRPELDRFLKQFDLCFSSASTRGHLPVYVLGQLSDLDRKSAEPMAKRAEVAPRTLQEFLSLLKWDHGRMRDCLQQIVVSQHSGRNRVGLIDETSFVKKGIMTPGVQRQWCGHLGKVENCVVTVHLGYAQGDFHCLLDGELFLPESWDADRERCHRAGIPDAVVYRPKWQIALGMYDRALSNGVSFDWLTFDEHYGGKPEFLRELDNRQQPYVAEVPKNIVGWLTKPQVTSRRRGRRRQPRLLAGSPRARRLDELLKRHRQFRDQPWTPYRIDDREQAPSVWEAKRVLLWTKNEDGLPGEPRHLVVARHVLRAGEVKYFLSNAPVDTPVETLLMVAFSRHRVERCFQDQKGEVGLADFEGRTYRGLIRHLILSCVSYLFLAQAVLRRAEKKSGVDGAPGPQGDRRPDRLPVVERLGVHTAARQTRPGNRRHAAEQRQGAGISPEARPPVAPSQRRPAQPNRYMALRG